MKTILLIISLLSLSYSKETIAENIRKLKRAIYYQNQSFNSYEYDERKMTALGGYFFIINIILGFFIIQDLFNLGLLWTILINFVYVFIAGNITTLFSFNNVIYTNNYLKIKSIILVAISLITYLITFFI